MSYQGFGAYYTYSGFGGIAEDFNGAAIWSKIASCSAQWQATKSQSSDCQVPINQLKAALTQLGYSMSAQGQPWSQSDISTYKKFCADYNLAPSANMGYDKSNIAALEGILRKQAPAAGAKQEAVPGTTQYVSEDVAKGDRPGTAASKAAAELSPNVKKGLIVAGVAGAGLLALAMVSKKKSAKKSEQSQTVSLPIGEMGKTVA